jgi:ubiquinol-cytochrome c reductase cytochrome b subunit
VEYAPEPSAPKGFWGKRTGWGRLRQFWFLNPLLGRSRSTAPTAPAGFWEERTGWSRLKQFLFLEPLPGGSRWTAAFGSLLLFVFAFQVVTGVLLTTSYAPSIDTAWSSVKYIQEDLPLGAFIRALHHWGSSAMVILVLFHLVQVFIWGSYKKPRELTWMVGVLLLGCMLGLAFTGYLLPWDQKAYWATKVGLGIASTTPLLGDSVRLLLQGGPEMGNLTLTRFFSIHAFLLPGLIIALIVGHLYLFRLHGITPSWWHSREHLEAKEEPFWPRQVWKDGVLALVFLIGLGAWCAYHPAPLEAQADPSQPYEARPEWYFMFLFQILRYFEGPFEIVGTFVLPALAFSLLFFWPFLDRSKHRDPRKRPVAMSLLAGGVLGVITMTVFAITTDVRMHEPAIAVAKPAVPAGLLQRADVAKIYNANCAACHGVEGSGQQVRAGMPTIPDFTSLAWQMSQTDLEITHRIQDGNEPLMPTYRDKLSEQQVLGLSIYVRAFAVNGTEPLPPKPAVSPPIPVAAQMYPEQIYRSYCLACHDADGRGSSVKKAIPEVPDFTDLKWQALRTDAELLHSILEGKGKFMLPTKDKLSKVDAERMVGYVRAFKEGKQVVRLEPQQPVVPPPPQQPVISPSPKQPQKSATSPSAETAARLRAATVLYRQYCLICHGADGQGSQMKASMPTIRDFTNTAWQTEASNQQIMVSILDGRGTLMPAFRGRVTEDQVQSLVAYVRAFGPVQPPRAEMPADDFENRFWELQRQWTELEKQLQEIAPPARKP